MFQLKATHTVNKSDIIKKINHKTHCKCKQYAWRASDTERSLTFVTLATLSLLCKCSSAGYIGARSFNYCYRGRTERIICSERVFVALGI